MDAHNIIPPGTSIGFDPEEDAKRYHVDKASGIVVVGMPQIQLRKKLQMPGTYDELFRSREGGF